MFLTPFIFGTLAAFFAIIIEIVTLDLGHLSDYSSPILAFSSLALLMAVALIEECSKYLFLRQYLIRYSTAILLTPKQIFSLGLGFGSGFSTIEAAFIISQKMEISSFLWLSGILFVHITTVLILVSFLKRPEKRVFSASFLPLFLAISVHFLYDAILSMAF